MGYLDPELLPFTAEELFRGLALATGDEQKAREVSHWFAEMLTGGAAEGVGWSLPDVVFAAMALVSVDGLQRTTPRRASGWLRSYAVRPSGGRRGDCGDCRGLGAG
jgi:hypothetical protein